jgi:hypothetical protein
MPQMPSLSSLLGSSKESPPAAGDAKAAYALPPNFECPSVSVRQGAGTLSVSSNPAEPNALNLRYQVGIGTTARECRLVGGMVTLKVGVEGRVILGPAGAPGEIKVPLRFAVVQEGIEPKTIATELKQFSVVIPPNDNNVPYTYVEDGLTFPMPPGAAIDYYVVYVGFDPLSAAELDKSKPKPKPARSRRRN